MGRRVTRYLDSGCERKQRALRIREEEKMWAEGLRLGGDGKERLTGASYTRRLSLQQPEGRTPLPGRQSSPWRHGSHLCGGTQGVLSPGICIRSPTVITCEHARCLFLVLSNVPTCIPVKLIHTPSFLKVWVSIIPLTSAYAGTHTEAGKSFTASQNLSLNPALPLSNDETHDSLTWLSLNSHL